MATRATDGVRKKRTPRGGFAEAFLGGAKGRVLALLLIRADGPMHLREVAREAGVAVGQLQREMRVLVDAGLLVRRRRGGRVLYEPDRGHALHAPLAGLLLADAGGLGGVLAERLAPLAGWGVTSAWLAGDARELVVLGDATPAQVLAAVAGVEPVTGRPLAVTVLRAVDAAADAATDAATDAGGESGDESGAGAARAWLDRRLVAGGTWIVGGPI